MAGVWIRVFDVYRLRNGYVVYGKYDATWNLIVRYVRDSFVQIRNEHAKSVTISGKGYDIYVICTHASFIPLLCLTRVYAVLE
jgi:hypothetical protein